MALDGFQVGTGSGPTGAAPAAPSPTPTLSTSALGGFKIGAAPAAPASSTALKNTAIGNSGNIASDAQVKNLVDQTPIKPANTSGLFSSFTSFLKDTGNLVSETFKGLPEASAKVSKSINDTIIQKPADLLGNTDFIKEASKGIDAGSFSGNFAKELLQKLTTGLSGVSGVTGGLYQTPDSIKKDNPDILDKGLTTLSQAIGMASGIGVISKAASAVPVVGSVTEGLTALVNKFPLVSKYIAPYIKPLVESATGFSIYGQLDPNLGANIKARSEKFFTDIGTSPLYTALGALQSAKYSLPASFILGFGMAKLSGASNQDAVISGASFSILDAAGRGSGERGLTPEEIQIKLHDEALKTLNAYSDVKLTRDSTPEQLKAAYRNAAHQTHPDVGGNDKDFNTIKNAYDLVSKGGATKTTESEKSIALLKGDIQDAVKEHGTEVTHEALKENLGVDNETANRLIRASQIPRTSEEIAAASKEIMASVAPETTLEQDRAPSVLQVTDHSTGESTMQAIHPDHFDKFKDLIDTGTKNKAQGLQDKTGKSYHLSATAAERMVEAGVKPVPRYADHVKISELTKSDIAPKENVPSQSPYYINTIGENGTAFKEVKGKKVSIGDGIDSFVHRSNTGKTWIVSEARSGRSIAEGKTVKQAVENAAKLIKDQKAKGIDIKKHIEGRVKENGLSPRFESKEKPAKKEAKKKNKQAEEKTFYRGGGEGSMPRGMTGKDIIEYETKELGNKIVSEEGVDLSGIKSENLRWFTTTEKAAKEYGEVEAHSIGDHRIIARDDQGGVLVEKISESEKEPKPLKTPANMQGGFVNPGAMVEDIVKGADAKIKDFIEKTMEPVTVSENLSDDIAKLEGAAQADLETVNKLVESLDITKKDDEALYTHAENPDAPLTSHQAELEKKFDQPLKKANTELYKRIKEITGRDLPESDTYISRFPKEKPSVMQRIFNPSEGRTSTAGQGGILSKSASSLKKRTMKSLVDESGNRTVASIKDGEVTAFRGKKPESLGKLKIKPKAELLDTEIKPLQKQVGMIQKTIASLEKLNDAQKVVSDAQIKNLDTEISDMVKFVDSHVGVFSNAELRPTIRKIQDKSIEFNTLTKVKQAAENNIITRSERLQGLQSDLLDLVNKMGEIEDKYNPDDLNKKVFVGNDGTHYTIGEATTAEIEEHTNLEYHHSAMASRLMQYVKLRQIDRANQFLESWKASPDFAKIAVKSSEIPPEGWRMTSQQNFRNYYFEPRTAEVLDDMQKKMESGMYNDAFQGINRVLGDAIFFNGLAHPINVMATWFYNRGVSSLAIPTAYKTGFKAFARALTAMRTKNADYMDLLKNGAHLMSSDVTNRKLAENMMKKLGDDLEKNSDFHDKLVKVLSYGTRQINLKTNVIYKLSHDMAWLSNDLFTMQAIFEAMDRHGMTMAEAIKDASRFIPDYRQQARLLDQPLSAVLGNKMGGATARNLAKNIMYNRNISMFGSYHVGLLQSLKNSLKDAVKPEGGFSSEGNAARARAFDKLAALAVLMLVVYPWLDKEFQKLTGSANTYVTRSGITKYPYLLYKLITGRTNLTSVATGVVTPAVGTQTAVELFFNRDLFTGNGIYGIGGEGLDGYLAKKIAPVAEVNKIATDAMTPGDFALSFLGIHTPKNDQVAIDLNQMIYTEKPNVTKKMKALVAGGDTVGAQKIGHDFNTKLVGIIKEADIQAGNSGSDARVQFFLNQYGVKMPGQVAMDNYNAKQGQNIVEKTLPNGKPVIVKDTPISHSSVIGTVATYAKAIGTDPITAFKDIFLGQSIKAVRNGAIIVNRMSLAQSQNEKAKLGGGTIPKGMTLDHRISLELGGTNDESNLVLVPAEQAKIDDVVENYLGDKLNSGKVSKSEAQKLEGDYKDHKITFDDIKKQLDK